MNVLNSKTLKILDGVSSLCGDDWEANGLSIDTRTIKKGNVFLALKGENFDGHNYIDSAIANGAVAIIIHNEKIDYDVPILRVHNTLDFLYTIARCSRKNSKATFIGITGSFGKTTVKEMIKTLLCDEKVYGSYGNYNNNIGLSFSLANMPKDIDYGVFELGTSNPGEIGFLSSILRPNVVIITAIGSAHIARLGNKKISIAKEKCCIVDYLEAPYSVILNADDELYEYMTQEIKQKKSVQIITFGKNESSDIRLINYNFIDNDNNIYFYININNKNKVKFNMKMIAYHFVIDYIIALTTLYVCGIDIINNNDKYSSNIKKFSIVPGRGNVHNLIIENKSLTVIDSTYNAAPEAVIVEIEQLIEYQNSKTCIILAPISELGDYAISFKKELIKYLKKLDLVIIIGEDFFDLADELLKNNCNNVFKLRYINEFLNQDYINNFKLFEYTVLIKGSNAFKLNLIVNDLLKYANY